MDAGEWRAGPRAMARHRAHVAASRRGAHRHFSIDSARSLKLIAYNVNPYNPYLFTSGKCTLSSSLSR